jgi:hypothetical protein
VFPPECMGQLVFSAMACPKLAQFRTFQNRPGPLVVCSASCILTRSQPTPCSRQGQARQRGHRAAARLPNGELRWAVPRLPAVLPLPGPTRGV